MVNLLSAHIQTPLGIATIKGDENGISVIAIADDGIVSEVIPSVLQDAVTQLQDYFEGKRIQLILK
jgi:methylated-DNA-[protein]-cysteine S-methyltransferase